MAFGFEVKPSIEQINPNQTAAPIAEERLSFLALWRVMMKRRMIILVSTVIFFAAVGFYAFRTTPVFESVSRIEINPNNTPDVGLESLINASQGGSDNALQTEMLILQSDSVTLKTAESLNLLPQVRSSTRVSNVAQNSPEPPPGQLTPRERLTLIGIVRGGLKVKLLTGTQVIEIRYRSSDPYLGTKLVNQLVDTYIDEDLQTRYQRTKHVSTWLQGQLDDLKQDAADAQRRLADYQKQHNIVGTDESSNLTMVNLAQISSEYENAEADRIVKEARMREFESKDTNMTALMGDNPELANLRSQLTGLETQRAELATRFGARHPKIMELDTQINKLRASIESEVKLAKRQVAEEYSGASRLVGVIQHRLDAQKEDAYRLNENEAQYAILRHEAELNRDLYDALQMRLKEAGVTAGLSATNITVIDRAQLPLAPIAPNKRLDLALGVVGGLLVGIAVAFLVESIDDSLQTSEEVESVSSLAALATIPHILSDKERGKRTTSEEADGAIYSKQLITLRNPKSVAAEAYRGLRSALLLSSIDKTPQVILLTSAFPGEGKTTTAVNLAIVLAQRGERVLLVDADLRRGTLNRVLNLTGNELGLSTVLSQPEGTQRYPHPFPDLPTLSVIITGPRPPNPAEMLSSHRMEEQIRQWRTEFDRIVFDTAPVLAVSDTQAMAIFADSVVLVARAGATRKRALVRARDLLLRINASITGVVVNDVDLRLENFYTSRYGMYGYSYGYKYRYGSPYSDKAYGFEDEEKGE